MAIGQLSDIESVVLENLFAWDQTSDYPLNVYRLTNWINESGATFQQSSVATALGTLRARQLVARTMRNGDWQWRIVDDGRQLVSDHHIRSGSPEQLSEMPTIPAADRYVSSRDNQPAVDQLKNTVQELIREVNENRDNDFTEKEGVLGELAVIDLQLGQSQISIPLMQTLFSQSVAWLAKKFVEVAIGQIALEALKLAAPLFGISV